MIPNYTAPSQTGWVTAFFFKMALINAHRNYGFLTTATRIYNLKKQKRRCFEPAIMNQTVSVSIAISAIYYHFAFTGCKM